MSMRETRIETAAVVDHEKAGRRLLSRKIYPPAEIRQIDYDRIFITADHSREILLESLVNSGIPQDSVILL